MNEMTMMVFLEPNRLDAEPFTTSKVIAEFAGVEHRKLKATIRKHEKALETFGILAPYRADIQGRGQPETVYRLDEQQATFVMTLLKNTPVVVEFKRKLVQAFFAMRQELAKRQLLRAIGKPIRRTLTDVIRDSGEVERMHGEGRAYSNYTNLAYLAAAGKQAKKIRAERGAKKDAIATDFLTSEEMAGYNKTIERIAVLLDMGMTYNQIKALLLKRVGIDRVS